MTSFTKNNVETRFIASPCIASHSKFRDKYRIESTRLRDYDYSCNGAYFITICTKNREHFFGEIVGEKLQETEAAKICRTCWLELPNHYPNYILDSFTIMPNHVHGILMINNHCGRDAIYRVSANRASPNRDAINRVSTNGGTTQNKNPMLHQNLSTIIRWYKGRATFEIRKKDAINRVSTNFAWQSGFYDHIIRNEDDLNHVREYIFDNPCNWENDRNNLTIKKTST